MVKAKSTENAESLGAEPKEPSQSVSGSEIQNLPLFLAGRNLAAGMKSLDCWSIIFRYIFLLRMSLLSFSSHFYTVHADQNWLEKERNYLRGRRKSQNVILQQSRDFISALQSRNERPKPQTSFTSLQVLASLPRRSSISRGPSLSQRAPQRRGSR